MFAFKYQKKILYLESCFNYIKILICLLLLNSCISENTVRNWVNKCLEDAESYVNQEYPKCVDAYMNYYLKYCELNAPTQGFIFNKIKSIDIGDIEFNKNKPTWEELQSSDPHYGKAFKAQREALPTELIALIIKELCITIKIES